MSDDLPSELAKAPSSTIKKKPSSRAGSQKDLDSDSHKASRSSSTKTPQKKITSISPATNTMTTLNSTTSLTASGSVAPMRPSSSTPSFIPPTPSSLGTTTSLKSPGVSPVVPLRPATTAPNVSPLSRSRSYGSLKGAKKSEESPLSRSRSHSESEREMNKARGQSKRTKGGDRKGKRKEEAKKVEPKKEVVPFSVTRIPDDYDVLQLVDFMSDCLFHDPRWVYLIPEEDKRPKVIRTVVRPTMKWMSQHGGNNIWLCTHNETGELLAVSVWLPPGVKVAIPFTKLVATSVSTFASVGVHGGKRVKNYFQGLTKWMQDNSPDDGWVLYYALVSPSSSLALAEEKAIITVPYMIKLQSEPSQAGKPIWTYVNDEALIPFYNTLGFHNSPLKKTEPYNPEDTGAPQTTLIVFLNEDMDRLATGVANPFFWTELILPLVCRNFSNFLTLIRWDSLNYLTFAPRIWGKKAGKTTSAIVSSASQHFRSYDLRGIIGAENNSKVQTILSMATERLAIQNYPLTNAPSNLRHLSIWEQATDPYLPAPLHVDLTNLPSSVTSVDLNGPINFNNLNAIRPHVKKLSINCFQYGKEAFRFKENKDVGVEELCFSTNYPTEVFLPKSTRKARIKFAESYGTSQVHVEDAKHLTHLRLKNCIPTSYPTTLVSLQVSPAINNPALAPKIELKLTKLVHLKSLSLQRLDIDHLPLLTNLNSLELYPSTNLPPHSIFFDKLQNLTDLTHLGLYDAVAYRKQKTKKVPFPPNLTSLRIVTSREFTEAVAFPKLGYKNFAPNLKHLKIKDEFGIRGLDDVLSCLPHLGSFKLNSSCHMIYVRATKKLKIDYFRAHACQTRLIDVVNCNRLELFLPVTGIEYDSIFCHGSTTVTELKLTQISDWQEKNTVYHSARIGNMLPWNTEVYKHISNAFPSLTSLDVSETYLLPTVNSLKLISKYLVFIPPSPEYTANLCMFLKMYKKAQTKRNVDRALESTAYAVGVPALAAASVPLLTFGSIAVGTALVIDSLF